MTDRQDWGEVVLRKKGPQENQKDAVRKAQQTGGEIETVKKFNAGKNTHGEGVNAKRIEEKEEEGDLHHDNVGRSFGQKLQQARSAKGWTQKELATKISEQAKVITDYENGKGTPNQQVISKLERVLGAKLR